MMLLGIFSPLSVSLKFAINHFVFVVATSGTLPRSSVHCDAFLFLECEISRDQLLSETNVCFCSPVLVRNQPKTKPQIDSKQNKNTH